MLENPGRKITLIVTLLLVSAGLLFFKDPAFNLGLDLQGGTRLVYRFDFDKAVEEGKISPNEDRTQVLQQTVSILRNRVDPQGVREVSIRQIGTDRIVIELPGNVGSGGIQAETTLKAPIDLDDDELELADAGGFPETGILRIGDEEIRYEGKSKNRLLGLRRGYNGVKRAHAAGEVVDLIFGDSIRAAIENLGELAFRIVAENSDLVALETDLAAEQQKVQAWHEANPAQPLVAFNRVPFEEGGPHPRIEWYPLAPQSDAQEALDEFARATPVLVPQGPEEDFRGEDLERVYPTQDRLGYPAVGFSIVPERVGEFAAFTKKYTNRRMAIVLNDEITSAPTIQRELVGGGIIQGRFTPEEVRTTMTVLRAGSLKLRPILESDERVGATLGDDYVRRGFYSGILALLVVLVFMVAYYRRLGVFSAISLLANFLLLMGGLAFLDATLTLPGIAGLILTVGMAVDANILIFDRLREEADKGRNARQAAKAGFEKALSAILDANITTFLTAVILYRVGTGPVRGFAATLMIGIVTSVFAALVITRVLVHYSLERGVKRYRVGTWLVKANYDFLSKAKPAIGLSIVMIVAGLAVFAATPDIRRLGIDFTGGVEAQVVTAQPMPIEALREKVRQIPDVGELAEVRPVLNSQREGGFERFRITIKTVSEETGVGRGEELRPLLQEELADVLLEDAVSFELEGTHVRGTLLFDSDHPARDVQDRLSQAGLTDVIANPADRPGRFTFEGEVIAGRDRAELQHAIEGVFTGTTDSRGDPFVLTTAMPSFSQVGPQVVGELRNKAVLALLISLFVIVMYIRVRFAEYAYGFAAVTALAHDVLVTLGALTLVNDLGLLNGEINLPMIAAFLTIIGYSLNDTIVIFDRVRENLPRTKGSLADILNLSVNQTLSRTILTSFTTFLAVAVLFAFNVGTGNVLESFSFAMMIGVITGTYSTIFIANPVLLWLENRAGRIPQSKSPRPKGDEDLVTAKA